MIARKALAALATVVLASMPFGAEAGSKKASCLLVVDGFEAVRGPCRFELMDNDGSFQIFGLNGKYFAQVLVSEDGVADGYWNKYPFAGHAETELGTLREDGSCWSNDTASVCAE